MPKLRKVARWGDANHKANTKTYQNRIRRKYATEQRNEAKKRKKDRERDRKKAERENIAAAKKAERERIAAAKKAERERIAAAKKAKNEREKALKALQKAREKHKKIMLKLNDFFLKHDLETHIDDFDLREFALKYIEENELTVNATSFKNVALPHIKKSLPVICKNLYEERLKEQAQLVYEYCHEKTLPTLDSSSFDSNDLKLIQKHIEWENIIDSEVDSWLKKNFEPDWISYVKTLDQHSTYESPKIDPPESLNNISELSGNIRTGFENVIPEAKEKQYQADKKEKTMNLKELIKGSNEDTQKLKVTNTQFNERFQRDLRL